MSIQSEAAHRFQSDVIRRTETLVARALRLWKRVPVEALDAGWADIEVELLDAVDRVAVQNAASSGRMVSAVARVDAVAPGDQIIPYAFAGVDGTGRSSAGLLRGAVTTTKQGIGSGMGAHAAFLAGASYLAAMTKTLVADVARSATTAASAGREYTRYVRVVSTGACSRCAILAGSDRFSYHFERHPACKCTSVPVADDIPDGLHASPSEHFWSLSTSEQDRIYTRAGAEAIRLGADPVQVVGARRRASGIYYSRAYPANAGQIRRMQRVPIGMKPDGNPIMGYVTAEGTSRRGVYGRMPSAGARARLMPETIMDMTEDQNLRRVLLRDAGYLEPPIRDTSSNSWIRERLGQQRSDRRVADDFYRSLGIDLY